MYTSISALSLCLSLSLSLVCVCGGLKWERERNINGRRREDGERASVESEAVRACKGGRLTEMRVFIGGEMWR